MAKLQSHKCPTCGAAIPVPPDAPSVTCRYCNNVITVERRAKPIEIAQFGEIRSTTLYIDPNQRPKGNKPAGCAILAVIALPILIPVAIFAVPAIFRGVKGAVRPFPAVCADNETIEVSGVFNGTVPAFESVGSNCKIHITKSTIKAPKLLDTDRPNLELTIDDSVIETTDVAIKTSDNLKLKVTGGSITSAVHVVDTDTNPVLTLSNTTLESTGDVAFHGGHNLKLEASNTKIRGKKKAFELEANAVMHLKAASEITSSAGIAVKTTSSLKLDAQAGKIEGAESAIVATSSTNITTVGTTFTGGDKALVVGSSSTLDFTDGAITSKQDVALDTEGANVTLTGTRVTGVTGAITSKNALVIKAQKKAAIVATNGDALSCGYNGQFTIADATVDASRAAIRANANAKIKLTSGAKLTGKKGGIVGEDNLSLDETGATIDGGSGPGLGARYNLEASLHQGSLKGTPALVCTNRPKSIEIDGSTITGDQQIPK